MEEKLKFKLDTIPARFGGGYKAKMCARTTVGTLNVIKDAAKALNLSPRMLVLHFEAVMDAILEDAATWKIELNGETLSGEFEILANDTAHLLLKWPEAILPSAVGQSWSSPSPRAAATPQPSAAWSRLSSQSPSPIASGPERGRERLSLPLGNSAPNRLIE